MRSGRWATLYPVQPLLPGTGDGNSLSWQTLGVEPPADARGWETPSWEAFRGFVDSRGRALGIDVRELQQPGRVTVHADGDLETVFLALTGKTLRDS